MTPQAPTDTSDLIACPECDTIYHAIEPAPGDHAICARCHHVMIRPRRFAGMRIIMMAVTTLILMVGAVFFPFLRIEVQGLANAASILDAVFAFADVRLAILSVITAGFILLIPALRMALLLYVLVPVVFDRPAFGGARQAFRWSEMLKPWSMAEIFAIGCAVSLVKVGDLARVEFGPAFWMFIGLVIVVVVQETFLCSWSIWKSLDNQST